MLEVLFSRSQPVLQSETGRETLPDNPSLPAPQDLIPPLFARALISKKNTHFERVCVREWQHRGRSLISKQTEEEKNYQATKTKGGKAGEKREVRGGVTSINRSEIYENKRAEPQMNDPEIQKESERKQRE